jgi:hypothetical protein
MNAFTCPTPSPNLSSTIKRKLYSVRNQRVPLQLNSSYFHSKTQHRAQQDREAQSLLHRNYRRRLLRAQRTGAPSIFDRGPFSENQLRVRANQEARW